MDISSIKKQVIDAGIKLTETGLIARTWGNVSARTGEDFFVITASGRDYLTLTEDEVVEVNITNLSHIGDVMPSSEKKVHREIYRLKKDANFVIHTHQSNASAVSAMGLKGIKLDREYPGIGNYVLCAEYGLPGSKKLCKNTADMVNEYDGKAIIMSNHGAICYGRDYEEAFQVANDLEEACGKYLKKIGVEPHSQTQFEFEEDGLLWNNNPVIMKYMAVRNSLKPYLDDFAQLIGTEIKVIDNDENLIKKAVKREKPVLVRQKGALCISSVEGEAEAVSLVVEKNCRAALAAIGYDPINYFESLLMRQFYLKKYSTRKK